MVRSDEFFNLIIELEGVFSDRMGDNNFPRKYGIDQNTLNCFNRRHNLPMERIECIDLNKAKDVFLEFFYLPVKSISNPEMHFNFIDLFYSQGREVYGKIINSLDRNFGNRLNIDDFYKWLEGYYGSFEFTILSNLNSEVWIERLSKIKFYFKHR
jgi:hypothetical protein